MENKPKHERFNKLKQAVSHRWILFNIFALFWFVFVFPTLFIFERGVFLFLSMIVMCFLVLLDSVAFDVAEKSPKTFLKIENMKNYFSKIYWVIYLSSIVMLLMIFLVPSNLLNEMSPIFGSTFIVLIIVLIGATFYQMGFVGNVHQQPRLLKARAKASFRVLSDSLMNPHTKEHGKVVAYLRLFIGKRTERYETKEKQIRLLKNGITNLNKLFINLFNLEFCNPNEYSDYFRFVVWSEYTAEINRIRRVLDLMECRLSRKIELSEILWATKQMLMETQILPKKELFKDLDFKTGLSRWYNHNKEMVQLFLLTLPIVVSVASLLYQFFISSQSLLINV